jgi:hypothetical protein
MSESVRDKLKALDEERNKLLEAAKTEALEQAERAVAELNELGFHYRLVEGAVKAPRKTGEQAPRKTVAEAEASKHLPCPICKFKTDPHHDGRARAHRSQKTKKPFTDAELAKLRLTKVE